MNKLFTTLSYFIAVENILMANPADSLSSKDDYWNSNSPLVSYRLPPPPIGYEPTYLDLDNDGDPDIIRSLPYITLPYSGLTMTMT